MTSPRPPLIGRMIASLLRGEGAEMLRGDIEESFRDGAFGRTRYVLDTLGSVARWWAPGAVRRRRRLLAPSGFSTASRVQRVLHEGSYAGRNLLRRPLHSLTVALTLALGIGAVTAIYSVVDAVVVRPLPYRDANRLMAVGVTFPGREWDDQARGRQHLAGVSVANYADWKARSRAFDLLVAVESTTVLMPSPSGGSELAKAAFAVPDFFDLFADPMAMGRPFNEDDVSGRNGNVVILSHGAWVRRYGADPGRVGGGPRDGLEVVGVLPPNFRQPDVLGRREIEFWMPLDPTRARYASRGRRSALILGRLAPGLTLKAAREELAGVQAEICREFPQGNVLADGRHFGAGVNSLQAEVVGDTGRALWIFLAASASLLLISALNAANLLLVRCLDREGEMGVRQALGASRGRIAAGLLMESLMLAALAGGLGMAFAYAGVEAFIRLAPPALPRLMDVAVNLRVLSAASVLSLGTGLLVGLLPTFRLGGRHPLGSIRASAAPTIAPGGSRLRQGLAVGQLALALLLSVGALLLVNSYVRLTTVDPGFKADNLYAFSMGMKRPGADPGWATWQHWDELRRVVEGVAGLKGVALSSNLPFEDPNWAPGIVLPDEPPTVRRTGVAGYAITPNLFETLGIPLKQGRAFTAEDGPGSLKVAVLNEQFVTEHMRGREAVGSTIRMRDDDDLLTDLVVVGVVGNVVQGRAEEGFRPAVYVPYTQVDWPAASVALLTERDPEGLGSELRRAVASFTPVPVTDFAAMQARIAAVQIGPRFNTLLIGAFATVALLLAAIGLHGTVAYSVKRRTREVGIRMAMGADAGRIFRMIFAEGLAVAGLGLGLGLVAAAGAAPLIRRFVFQIDALDAPTFFAAFCLLGALASLAMVWSARRAARVDPVESLRAE